MTFSAKMFFLQKYLNFCMCFSINSLVFFLLVCTLLLRKTKSNIEACTMNATKWNKLEHFRPKKDTGECFFLLNRKAHAKIRKAHAKIQALSKGKKIYPKKSLATVLHQGIQLFT